MIVTQTIKDGVETMSDMEMPCAAAIKMFRLLHGVLTDAFVVARGTVEEVVISRLSPQGHVAEETTLSGPRDEIDRLWAGLSAYAELAMLHTYAVDRFPNGTFRTEAYDVCAFNYGLACATYPEMAERVIQGYTFTDVCAEVDRRERADNSRAA